MLFDWIIVDWFKWKTELALRAEDGQVRVQLASNFHQLDSNLESSRIQYEFGQSSCIFYYFFNYYYYHYYFLYYYYYKLDNYISNLESSRIKYEFGQSNCIFYYFFNYHYYHHDYFYYFYYDDGTLVIVSLALKWLTIQLCDHYLYLYYYYYYYDGETVVIVTSLKWWTNQRRMIMIFCPFFFSI